MRKIGLDIDGVLANFTDTYAALLTKLTGITFPKFSKEWPDVWYWDRKAGVEKTAEKEAWSQITSNEKFWENLKPLPDTKEVLMELNHLVKQKQIQLYFLTNRPGDTAKLQTERWLYELGVDYPTVLMTSADKAPVIYGLGLDFFIDDKLETINDTAALVAAEGSTPGKEWPIKGHIFLKDWAYNRQGRRGDVRVVDTLRAALEQDEILKPAEGEAIFAMNSLKGKR